MPLIAHKPQANSPNFRFPRPPAALELLPLIALPFFPSEACFWVSSPRSVSNLAPLAVGAFPLYAMFALILLDDLRSSLIIYGLWRGWSGERVA